MRDFLKLIVSIALCESVGILGSFVTIPAISTWYATLNKAPFNPPSWIFGPVWTVLFFIMGISMFLVWKKGLKKKNVKNALMFFLVQLVFNFLWSYLFFGLHSPFLAFINIIFLWVAILLTILRFNKVSKSAAYLLYPYILWVSFASILNLFVVILNR